MKRINGKIIAIAVFFLALGGVASKLVIDSQRSSRAIYVVLGSEAGYAKNYYGGIGTSTTSATSQQVDAFKIHTHTFSLDVGGGETYSGRSFLYNYAVIILVDSPKASGWLITDPTGRQSGGCKKLFGSDGTEEAFQISLKDICSH